MKGKKLTFDSDMLTILAMIRQFKPPPSTQDMVDATPLSSTSTVSNRLEWLEVEGYIKRNLGTRRTCVATQKGLDTFPEFVVVKKRITPPQA